MKVRELKKILRELPDDMDVFLDERVTNEFTYGLANSVKVKEVTFCEDERELREPFAIKKCLIISEE